MEENGKTHIQIKAFFCGMIQRPERMGIDIKSMETRLFNSYASLKLGKNIMEEIRLSHQFDACDRMRTAYYLEKLVLYPFLRDFQYGSGFLLYRIECLILYAEIKFRCETAGTDHPQRILPEPLMRISYCPYRVVPKIIIAAVHVDDVSVGAGSGKGIDREVPAFKIAFKRADEFHTVRMPPVGVVPLAPECCHFIALLPESHRHCTVLQACGNTVMGKHRHDFIGRCVGGIVIIIIGDAENVITHGSAHQIKLPAMR